MTELFNHQKEGIRFLKEKRKAILADSMGMGKSRQAIVAAGDDSDGAILVICPASLKINWEREIKAVYPEDYVVIIGGSGFNSLGTWYIVNYDRLQKYEWLANSLAKGEIDTVIIDEAHYIKGRDTLRSKKTLELAGLAKRVYCLTGTPVMNRPIEVYNLLKAIGHPLATKDSPLIKEKDKRTESSIRRAFGVRYCGAFLHTINRRFGQTLRFWDESGATRIPELREKISDIFLRRTKEEVLDLPDKIITIEPVELSEEWQVHYDMAWERYLDWVASHPEEGKDLENILSAQALVELTKLKQVCSMAKIDRIAGDIENALEQGEKVIVFTQYNETIKTLQPRLQHHKSVTLTGSDDMEKRQASIDSFQNDPECKVFIANMKAGGVGINLTAATIVIFADMDWSPEVHNQAMDRAHRIGQKGTVNVYFYVLEDTIEENILDMLDMKKAVIKEVMGEGEHAAKVSMADFIKKINQRKR